MHIDVFHDTVCPWCRIGKRHLRLALEGWAGEPVTIRYRSFFLNPDMPPEGSEFAPYMIAKGGGRMKLEDFFDGPRRAGAAAGLTFNFERIERAPNSLLSHRLIAVAPEGDRDAVLDAIYAAYFEFGRDIGDMSVLLDVAQSVGLDVTAVRGQLAGAAGLDDVLRDVAFAREVGISGVPFFIFNDKYAFSGAQPPATIARVMRQVADEMPASQATPGGDETAR